MKKYINKLIRHPLISGTIIVFAGSLIGNVFNFLFNIFMSRSLSLIDYGILISLTSIISLCGMATDSFVPTIVHFAATYFATKSYAVLKGIFITTTKVAIVIGLVACIFFAFFAHPIGHFFHLENTILMVFVGIIIFLNILGVVNRAMLQAKLAFFSLSFVNLLNSLTKFIFGIIFILLGMKVFGAVYAIIISFILPYIFSFFPIKNVLQNQAVLKEVNIKKIIGYGTPAALSIFFVSIFVTSDIILVKHFFPPADAGLYAGLSLIGKVIFFISAPIGSVMFPLITQKRAKGESFFKTFLLSLSLVAVPSFVITIFYFLFPAFTIQFFLKQKAYLSLIPYVGLFGIFLSLYSILSVTTNFFLSLKKTKVFIPIGISAILQAIGIWVFHANFYQIIEISIICVSIPLVLLIIFCKKIYESKEFATN